MKTVKYTLIACAAALTFASSAMADVVRNVNMNVQTETLPLRSVLGITSQAGYAGQYFSSIEVCATSSDGTGTATVIENGSLLSGPIAIGTTSACYQFPLPMPGTLDVGSDSIINTIQLQLNGTFNITTLGAFQE